VLRSFADQIECDVTWRVGHLNCGNNVKRVLLAVSVRFGLF
jgi:hypothetical protein